MEIDGDWEVRYSAIQEQPFNSEEGDPEEAATITLNEGKNYWQRSIWLRIFWKLLAQ